MPKFIVSANVTISVWTEVEADTEQEAMALAEDRPMQTLCHQCSGTRHSQGREEWRTSGELDGSPFDLAANHKDE